MTLTVGSLFSGIGGLDLGLERAGMRVVWQSEIDPYACRVLAKHWPGVPNLGDVTTVDWSSVERPDLICGGFPCQPVSAAGRRRAQADERWLWPWYADAVRHLRPGHVLVENVPGLLTAGMGDVLGDLADLRYDAEWTGVPAAAVGAPHLRWRIFIVAHAQGAGCQARERNGLGAGAEARVGQPPRQSGSPLAHTIGEGLEIGSVEPVGYERQAAQRGGASGGGRAVAYADRKARNGEGSASQEVFGPGPVERPGRRGSRLWDHWAVEPDVGRVAHGIPHRVDRLRCLGNAVVPQVAEYVGRRILEATA